MSYDPSLERSLTITLPNGKAVRIPPSMMDEAVELLRERDLLDELYQKERHTVNNKIQVSALKDRIYGANQNSIVNLVRRAEAL